MTSRTFTRENIGLLRVLVNECLALGLLQNLQKVSFVPPQPDALLASTAELHAQRVGVSLAVKKPKTSAFHAAILRITMSPSQQQT